jgi:hypothetical protein
MLSRYCAMEQLFCDRLSLGIIFLNLIFFSSIFSKLFIYLFIFVVALVLLAAVHHPLPV